MKSLPMRKWLMSSEPKEKWFFSYRCFHKKCSASRCKERKSSWIRLGHLQIIISLIIFSCKLWTNFKIMKINKQNMIYVSGTNSKAFLPLLLVYPPILLYGWNFLMTFISFAHEYFVIVNWSFSNMCTKCYSTWPRYMHIIQMLVHEKYVGSCVI